MAEPEFTVEPVSVKKPRKVLEKRKSISDKIETDKKSKTKKIKNGVVDTIEDAITTVSDFVVEVLPAVVVGKQPLQASTYVIKKPLLADTLDDLTKLNFPCHVTPKLDGIRALRLGGDMLSRQYKQIRNIRMRSVLKDLLPEGSDGEIMVEGTFQDVTKSVMSISGSENFSTPFSFYWFDYVKDDPKKSYTERLVDMKNYISEHPEVLTHPQAKIIPLYPTILSNAEEVFDYEKKVLAEGFEGVMVRKPDGPYKMGRSTMKEGILLKLKKFSDAEAVVVGVQELQHNNNEKVKSETGESKRSQHKEGKTAGGKLGSLLVENEAGQKFNIGSGFTDNLRVDLWKDKDNLLGKLVKYKYFEVGSKDAPRFPTFLGFRHPDDM